MNIRLDTLKIQNFKGIKDLFIDFGGECTDIRGENATGKTTIYDSFIYLLFDKDSTNRKDFSIKPHNPAGEEIHFLETSVEAVLLLDGGKRTILRKVYSEKWVKRRGEADRTFSGHETEYFVNDTPKKKNEYTAIVDAMIDEQDFKLITNPDYFNGVLGWQERRQELFKLSGHSMTDEEIIAGAPEFADLRDNVSGRSSDDARSAAQYALKKIKDEIKGIPIRIDEINRGLPETYDLSPEEWARQEQLRDGVRQKIEDIESRLADAQTIAQAHAGKLQAVEDHRAKLRIREAEIKEEAGRDIRDAQFEIESLESRIKNRRQHIDNLLGEIPLKKSIIDEFESKAPGWRTEFDDVMAQEFVEPTETPACSLCGQPLPAEMAAKDTDELRRAFYEQRDAKAAEIQARGKDLKAKADRAAEDIKSYQKAIDEAKAEIAVTEKQIAELRDLAGQDVPKIIPLEDDEYADLMGAFKAAEADAKKTAKSGTVEDLLHDKRVLQESLSRYDEKLAARSQREAAVKRIAELKAQERELAAQVIAQEKIINLIEKFISYKSGLIEEKINAMFPTARFRLFETQINGGIVDCCDCMIGGVPYADANNAAKINAGLEIIDVISRERGITAPIFIDNRESVNELYRTGAQVINLIVSKDKKLRIETSKKKEEVA